MKDERDRDEDNEAETNGDAERKGSLIPKLKHEHDDMTID